MAFNLNTNAKAERKLVVTFVKVGGTLTPIGAGIEDSAIELSPDVSVVTDILGNTEATLNKFELAQSFDPFTIRGGSALAEYIFDQYMSRNYANLSNFEVVIAYGFKDNGSTSAKKFVAEKFSACTIVPTSIGGSATVDMPIELTLAGTRTSGYVDKLSAGATFTS